MSRVMRVVSLDKYSRFLRDRALHLARLDQFEDDKEGTLTQKCLAEIKSGKRKVAEHLLEAEDRKLWSRQFYATCWHMSPHESALMWNLYGGRDGKDAVCIVSKYARLKRIQSDNDASIGVVSYVDYSHGDFLFWDDRAPFMHKQVEYSDEREIRILHARVCSYFLLSREEVQSRLQSTQPKGYRLRCSPEFIVEEVRVSPRASDAYFAEVVEITKRLCPRIAEKVTWSDMKRCLSH